MKNAVYFIVLSALMTGACKKAPNYPKEPSINLKEFKVISDMVSKTDTIQIVMNFKDGDGDIGNEPLAQNDLFIKILRKESGVYNEVIFTPISFDGKLPLFSPYNLTGPIDGTISRKLNFEFPLSPTPDQILFQYDTLKFQVRIKDRADNYSNWIETDSMVLWRNF